MYPNNESNVGIFEDWKGWFVGSLLALIFYWIVTFLLLGIFVFNSPILAFASIFFIVAAIVWNMSWYRTYNEYIRSGDFVPLFVFLLCLTLLTVFTDCKFPDLFTFVFTLAIFIYNHIINKAVIRRYQDDCGRWK